MSLPANVTVTQGEKPNIYPHAEGFRGQGAISQINPGHSYPPWYVVSAQVLRQARALMFGTVLPLLAVQLVFRRRLSLA